ncbi:MAG: type II secretion system secretin GspD [Gammaproteobacteria bacterium]|nr:type II secretion system secretin GspD [Gammaproteobacteria bacterium]
MNPNNLAATRPLSPTRRLRRAAGLALATALLVLLAGCAAREPRPVYRPFDTYAQSRQQAAYDQSPAVEQARADDSSAPQEGPDTQSLTQIGTGSFINEDVARRSPPGPGPVGEVSFNFEGESLHAVVKAILGDFLQQNYVIAPGVQGNVTFSTAKPLRGDQALSILEMLLRWNNTTMVWQDGRYTILPVAQALPGNLTPRSGPLQNMRGYEVRAVPLQYISTMEMEKVLKPYAKPEAIVSVDPARNMLVLAGSRAELENYLHTVAVFDVDWLEGMSVGVFNLTQTEAAKTVTELEKIFGEGSNTPMAGMFRFLPLEGINAILVITPQPRYLSRIEEWIERFDLGGGQAGQRLYTYDVKNVKAIDLATTLSDVFGSPAPTQRTSSGGSVAPGLESVQVRSVGSDGSVTPPNLRNQNNQNLSQSRSRRRSGEDGQFVPAVGDGGPVVDATGGIALGAADDVRISAVEESNSLLVLATSTQWESIRRVIDRLDTIPLQVHIEAKILQVTLTEQLKYGVQWFFENGIAGDTVGGLRELASTTHGFQSYAGTAGRSGVGWTFIGHNLVSMIDLLDSLSSVHVLSMPSLVTLNNKAATITVGTQIPVNSVINNYNPGIGTGGNQTYVQFRDTGVTLTVTPRVNPGGLVFMEIDQTDSSPGNKADAVGENVPVNQRKIQAEVAVQSGQTVLLGGLIKQTDSKASSGVPGLHRIPIIGALFGGKDYESAREELLVMITPRVISNSDDARRLTEEYGRQFRALEPLRAQGVAPATHQSQVAPEDYYPVHDDQGDYPQ